MTATFETLLSIDAKLVSAGHHPLTPWWKGELQRFYSHPTARTYIGQCGRGSAKSHTSSKIGLNEALFGEWKIPPGERHYWAYVSKSKDEAAQRLKLIESFLRALGIKFDATGDEIALRDLACGFRVFGCQVGANSGFRCIGYSADELAKWLAGIEHANPAEEVCASLNAMTITHPGARKLLISSPYGQADYHYERFAMGDNADQICANAPSWIANPSGITEAMTRRAEPNARIWSREYAAIASSNVGSAFDLVAVDRAFAPFDLTECSSDERILVVDPSSGRKDTWAWSVVSVETPREAFPSPCILRSIEREGVFLMIPFVQVGAEWVEHKMEYRPPVVVFHEIGGLEGAFFDQISADKIVDKLARLCRRWGIRHVHGDQREDYALASLFAKVGLKFQSHAWTSSTKPDAIAHLRRWFADTRIVLPAHDKLRKELMQFEERITPSGALTFGARGSGHDDYVALLITTALTDIEGGLPGSPFRRGRSKREVTDRIFAWE